MNDKEQSGFTLIELMVALFIFSLLAVGGAMLLRSSVTAQEVSKTHQDEMAELRRLNTLMAADFAQAIGRVSRNNFGEFVPAFVGRNAGAAERSGEALLVFSRGGWSNLDDSKRSNIQRVEYHVADGRLSRRNYVQTDGGEGLTPALLIEGISGFTIKYRDNDGRWSKEWEPERSSEIPRAIDIGLILGSGQTLQQIFVLGAGY